MNKSEMIKWLQNLKEDIGQTQHQDLWHYAEMLDEVISAIEINNDCISRVKAIEEVKALPNADNGYSDTYDKACIIGVLEELPSATPKENIGTRKEKEAQSIYGKIIQLTCCECGDIVNVSESAYPYEKYCRYCGSKMRG